MTPEAVLNLLEDQAAELLVLALFAVENLIHEAYLKYFLEGDALAHDKRLVGLGNPHPLDEGMRGKTLGHEANAGERDNEEGVGTQ